MEYLFKNCNDERNSKACPAHFASDYASTKAKTWKSALLVLLSAVFCFSSCADWGEWDDPAGNQVYPTLEKLVSYTFEPENEGEEIEVDLSSIFRLFAYPEGNIPTLDENGGRTGNVVHFDGGYARIDNPVSKVKVQNGVSLTFWMKQIIRTDAETGKELAQDLEGAIFSFQSEDGSEKMFFTANGWLSYDGPERDYEDNNPAGYNTGLMSAGEWHYVAMTVRDDGYAVYVDGLKKIDKQVPDYDFSQIVQFMASAPYLYIGYGSGTETGEWMIDDLTLYRNRITDSQIKVPGGGSEEVDDKKYIVVGNEDYSTGWWTAFSDLVTATGDQTIHFGFYNFTNGNANWNNWLLVLTNGKDRNEPGYAEHFVLRADAFGWGDANYSGDNFSHNFNFDDGSFTNDMKGAYVDLSIKRTGNRIDVTAVVTATGGTTYRYTFFYEGEPGSSIGAFLTCEGAYLKIDPEAVLVGDSYPSGSYRVGPADCSAGWWSHFSGLSKISGSYTTYPFVYTFYNYTNGSANWNNWLLVATNGKDRGEDGYAEYFVLRADAFGWGDAGYAAENISASYNWDSFSTQMNGAYCMIILNRSGNRLEMTAKVTTADGVKLDDYTFFHEGITSNDVGVFLTVEGASLDMLTAGYYPFLNTVE